MNGNLRRIALITMVMVFGAFVAPLGTSTAHDDGALRFRAELTGNEEVPDPVVTETTGKALFKVNEEKTKIAFKLSISDAEDILGAAGAHIHCGPAGVNGPIAAFLAGVVDGGLSGNVTVRATLTNQNIKPTDCGDDIVELVDSMKDGNTYVNVHSLTNPPGEVRGQIAQLVEDDDDDDDDD